MRRFWLHGLGLVVVCLLVAPPAPAQDKAVKAVTVKGRVVRMQGPDRFIVRTADNKELTFYTNPRTRYMLSGKAAKYTDLRAGTDITAIYVTEGDRYIVNSVTTGEATEEAPPEGTVVEGSVVRVIGEDQVVVRTAAGKEVIVYVSPQTKYTFEERVGRFTDLRPGASIRVNYDVRDRRNMARSIVGVKRKK
jgi:translation initiation factor IF-1